MNKWLGWVRSTMRDMPDFRSSTLPLLEKAIGAYIKTGGGITKASAVRDVLSDLRHYCELNDVDFDEQLDSSLDLYLEEREGAEDD